jgi:hypothetical protein
MKIGIIVMALFQLHNFLKDIGEADLPDIGSGLGERQEGELLRAVNVTPDGYDDNYHPSDTFHTKEAGHGLLLLVQYYILYS